MWVRVLVLVLAQDEATAAAEGAKPRAAPVEGKPRAESRQLRLVANFEHRPVFKRSVIVSRTRSDPGSSGQEISFALDPGSEAGDRGG